MEEFPVEKRNSSILAMDVVGYSRLIEDDELGTIRALRRLRTEIITPILESRGGRLVKTMGDGFLIEFSSPDAALLAAIDVQEAAARMAQGVSKKRHIILRIGANLGDIVVDGTDILGDGVNIAARLEGLAQPGGVAVTEPFFRALQPDLAARLTDDGYHKVKNISRPIAVWRWQIEGAESGLQHNERSSRPPTIAVLSFINRSPEPEQSYFAEGMADDIISALQHMRRLPVVAGASSLSIDPKLEIEDASRLLGARYLVKGSVRRAGLRVRVTVELIEGQTGHSLWSEKYDRALEDVFDIQDDITQRVVTALDTELVESEINRLNQQRPQNLGAWDRYLRGMSHLRNVRIQDLKKARQEFLAAIEIEPDYGEAWAALAWVYLKEYGFSTSRKSSTDLEDGYEAAKKGVAFAERSPFAHYSMSTAHVWRGEKELSLKELEHAIQLNPYFTRAKLAYYNRRELADPSVGLEAAEEIRKALALSPREPDRAFYFWSIARINLVAGEFMEALDWTERAVSVQPSNPTILYRHALCLAAVDRVDKAVEVLNGCNVLSPGFLDNQRDWRPYDDDDRNKKVFEGFRRNNIDGWG